MFIENIHRVFGVFLIRPRIGLSFIIFHTSNSNCLESEAFIVIEFYCYYHIIYDRG